MFICPLYSSPKGSGVHFVETSYRLFSTETHIIRESQMMSRTDDQITNIPRHASTRERPDRSMSKFIIFLVTFFTRR